jgi:uncharacterized protein (UPF0179 family)
MKFQDQYPFDKSLYGINNVYYPVGYCSHYVNSDCIKTSKKILTNGKKYLIVSIRDQGSLPIVHKVRLMDVFFNTESLYLFVTDLLTQKSFIIDLNLVRPADECEWIMCNMEDYDKINHYKIKKAYCKKCTDTHTKSITKNTSMQSNDELLDFEF